MTNLRMMTVIFNLPLKYNEIKYFRGAIINIAGSENKLFHNHNNSGFEYRYPIIQYRIIGGKAAVVCINDGIEELQAFFAGNTDRREISIGARKAYLEIENISVNKYRVTMLDETIKYRISRWVSLNQQNFKRWKNIDNTDERIKTLESILIGNIISFAKRINWQIPKKINLSIDPESIDEYHILYKGQSLMAFSLKFSVNIFLPKGIALGKGVSVNCGVLKIDNTEKSTEIQ